MKAIIYRLRATGKMLEDNGEYELLRAQGKTDKEIAAMVESGNSRAKDRDLSTYAELVELDELAQFYKNKQKERRDDDICALADMRDRLQDLASDLEAYVRRLESLKRLW